jgi:nitrogen PTS system EIIA component
MSRKADTPLTIEHLIDPKRIVIIRESMTKVQLIEKLLELVLRDFPNLKTESEDILEKVMHREKGISTTLDTGLSIPHARVDDVRNFIVAMAMIPDGIKDSSQQGIEIKCMFMFLSPLLPTYFKKHLQLLSTVSSLFQPELIDKLNRLDSPEEIAKELSSIK